MDIALEGREDPGGEEVDEDEDGEGPDDEDCV